MTEPQMKKEFLLLDGSWQFKEFPEDARRMRDLEQGHWLAAKAPSSIFTCLMDAGIIDRFEVEANPSDYQWVSEKSWIFRKDFILPESLRKKDRIEAVFEGLDTVTQIWLNEKLIGKTHNMFIPHRFDITGLLKPQKNTLYIKFLPVLKHAERLMQRYGALSEHHFGDPRRCYVRKAQYQFGSVLGPALPGCGIFRPVRLEGIETARLADLSLRTVDCNQHYADIRIGVTLERAGRPIPLRCKVTFTGGGFNMTQEIRFDTQENHHTTLLHIDRPILWWPKGYGVQHLYHVRAELTDDTDTCLDILEQDFGIRHIRVNQTRDDTGHSFCFEVNEQPIYVKGANWLPASLFPGTPTDYTDLLRHVSEAHCNMLRVWAGGYYEDPAFYQACDRLGILVWQDFMFASGYYPDRQWFIDMIKSEGSEIIRQLRNHACLALWCGNSRIDHLHDTGRLGTGRKFYGKGIYHEVLPGLLSETDPSRDYIPTTPYSPGGKDLNTPESGTCHHWELWNNYASVSDCFFFESQIPRFAAEFGMQSLPAIKTLETFCKPIHQYRGAWELEKHYYQPGSLSRLARYIADEFSPAASLRDYQWQSQVVQARAIKYIVERLRAFRQINAGCLFWTWNDFSPTLGFSAVDQKQHPKALFYYARRFFSPVTAGAIRGIDGSLRICVVNDTASPITGTVDCRLLDWRGQVLDETQMPVTVSPFSTSKTQALPKSCAQPLVPRESFLSVSLLTKDSVRFENLFFFCPQKYFRQGKQEVEIDIQPDENSNEWSVRLLSKSLVRDVQILPPEPARLSDNFITLLPGRPVEAAIHYQNPPPSLRVPLQLGGLNTAPSR